MERFTYIDHLGWYVNCPENERLRGSYINRLAEYEDTRLTPEQVAGAISLNDFLADCGVSIDRLRELVSNGQDILLTPPPSASTPD